MEPLVADGLEALRIVGDEGALRFPAFVLQAVSANDAAELDLAKTLLQAVLVIIPLLVGVTQYVVSKDGLASTVPVVGYLLMLVYVIAVTAVFFLLEFILSTLNPGEFLRAAILCFYILILAVGIIISLSLYDAAPKTSRWKDAILNGVIILFSIGVALAVWQTLFSTIDILYFTGGAFVLSSAYVVFLKS